MTDITKHLNSAIRQQVKLEREAGDMFIVTLTFEDTAQNILSRKTVLVKNYNQLEKKLINLEKKGHIVSYSCRRYEELIKTKQI